MESFLQKLLAVSSIQDEVITHFPKLNAILGNKSCTVSNFFSCLNFEFHFTHYNSLLSLKIAVRYVSKVMTNREQLILSKNKFEQAGRTTVQASNSLESIYVPRTSRVTNIFKKFANLAGQNHSSDGHEAGCFNRDLTRGQGGLPFLSKKKFF